MKSRPRNKRNCGAMETEWPDRLSFLFIHVPKFSSYYRPIGEYMIINYIPMGVFALADLLDREGHPSRIIHLGVEWIEDPGFSISRFLRDAEVQCVALPLHWHYQAYDVIEVVKKIKALRPDLFVLLGGFTASYFAEEILTRFPEVDAVVRGDAEEPVRALADAHSNGGAFDLEGVPNLAWRKNGEVHLNEITYVARGKDLDALRFARLELMRNYPTYVDSFGLPLAWAKGFSRAKNRRHQSLGTTLFPLCVGRGCAVDCTWCGGGACGQRLIGRRESVAFRSPDRVVETMEEAVGYGYETMHVSFDPLTESVPYYRDLFRRVRERGLSLGMYFECWGLPDRDFAADLARTFDLRRSTVAISPEVGPEGLRARHRGYPFDNEAFFESMRHLEALGVSTDVFFTVGAPFETQADAMATKAMIRRLRSEFRTLQRCMVWPIQLEPASPAYVHPERYGIEVERRSFLDFYYAHSGQASPGPTGPGGPDAPSEGETYTGLGYGAPEFFGDDAPGRIDLFEERLRNFRCRHFCFFHPDPRRSSSPAIGRFYCRLRALRWSLSSLTRRRRPRELFP